MRTDVTTEGTPSQVEYMNCVCVRGVHILERQSSLLQQRRRMREWKALHTNRGLSQQLRFSSPSIKRYPRDEPGIASKMRPAAGKNCQEPRWAEHSQRSTSPAQSPGDGA